MPPEDGARTLRVKPKRASPVLRRGLFVGSATGGAASLQPAAAPPVLEVGLSRLDAAQPGALQEQWHEVALVSFLHPKLRRRVILVSQNDVSSRIWAERQLARVVEAEHTLLENIFPHHVIEHITATIATNLDESGTPFEEQQQQDGASDAGAAGDMAQVTRDQDVRGSSAMDTAWLPAIRGDTFRHLSTSHTAITILFCDIQGFTPMCSQMRAVVVMSFLNDLFTRLDGLLDEYGVYKVETIGDCYVAAGGLMRVDEATGAVTVRSDDVDPLHAYRTVQFAKALLRAASHVSLPTGDPVRLRVGIHSGPAMSGVVGTRMPRFCLFGDTMNVASRMESMGEAGAIHVSQATRELLPCEAWESRGGMEVKGKGVMETYLLRV
ncbi:Atrial natriuretic peptide receptor 2 [Tetrabaena socialis]|uniref:Atrial natriuretic peptide receptor 2 n=1 Tax=Tetrabaena socialis TaxID=47790 RepID=A0A2J8ACW2_9CHLO|nr:Atrial natriuretic peptide receptor 2 [Tetrabaena socialis]|eukprot:PNH10352.1 Atrial natriuretic peptide receptor 2 [Tetrabaena socialis]